MSIRVLLAVTAALDARLVVQLRWRAGELDRLLDADHALVAAAAVELLRAAGWEPRVEVTYATPRGSGSIDILAWQPQARSLLVIEVKTEITSAEATLRKLDEKVSLGAAVARGRFGWEAAHVSSLLVIEDISTNHRRVRAAAGLFGSALPMDGRVVRGWLSRPVGSVAGRLFLSVSNRGGGIQGRGGRHRIRRAMPLPNRPAASVARDDFPLGVSVDAPRRTILVG